MKILNQNLKHGKVKIKVDNLDDLWYLSNIVDPGDLVKGRTLRKIKIGESTDRKMKVSKKPVFLEIKVEKIEFHKTTNALRIAGVITQGPEDVAHGEHHTFNAEENTVIQITKEKWLKFQVDKLKEAASAKHSKILICVHDREEAFFALSKKYGYEMLTSFTGDVQKKAVETKQAKSFYNEVIKMLGDYAKRHKVSNIVLASPAFFKEDLMKELKDTDLRKKIVLATCSSVKEDAINEVLRRPEVQQVLKQDRIAKEVNLVEELFQEISKEGKASYGLKQVKETAEAGAVAKLLVTDSLIRKTREKGTYKKIEEIMKLVDSMKGGVHIISAEHEAGKKLDGLGGIGAILRYRLSY